MFFKKGILFCSLCVVLVFSIFTGRVLASECSNKGYTVLTINGIFTDEINAQMNAYALKHILPKEYKHEKINVEYVLNQSHSLGVADIIDAARQGFFNQKTDYDFTEIMQRAHEDIDTQKLLLVGHSQGNFYANNFYDLAVDKLHAIPKESIGVYAVATPADFVSGEGQYITSDTDAVITMVAKHAFSKTLPSNDHINTSGMGHDFADVYLRYKGSKISGQIKKALAALQSNTTQESTSACIPELPSSMSHLIYKKFFLVTDTVANTGRKLVGSVVDYLAERFTSLYDFGVQSSPLLGSSLGALGVQNSNDVVIGNTEDVVAPVIEIKESATDEPLQGIKEENIEDAFIYDDLVPDKIESDTSTEFQSNTSQGSYSSGGGSITVSSPQVSIDTIAPTISLIGSDSITIGLNEIYTDAGAIALDDVDGSVVVHTAGIVDTSITGTYVVSYTATDVSGNTASASRTVFVEVHTSGSPQTQGTKKYFDRDNKILYMGDYSICNINTHSIYTNGNNLGVTNFVSSSNWQTSYQMNPNIDMPININLRYIFGTASSASVDCQNATFTNDYSDTFHYITSSGSSVVAHNAKIIHSFNITNLVPTVTGNIDDTTHIITLAVPPDADISDLVPTISFSDGTLVTPQSDISVDFTNPVVYSVKASDNSVQEYQVSVLPSGEKFYFDFMTNKIQYQGNFLLCNIDAGTVTYQGNNLGVSYFVSSSNWQTPYQATANSNMPIHTNFRYIFGDSTQALVDCTSATYRNDYSDTFYYDTSSGASVVYARYVHTLNHEKLITSFSFNELSPVVSGVIDNNLHTISLTVPFGTSISNLAPTIFSSVSSVVNPVSGGSQDFTHPVSYNITAEDGSVEIYQAIVTVSPETNMPSPDSGLPTITAYTFNGAAGNITTDPITNNLEIVLSANKNVDWVSVKIENQNDSSLYKIFQSGASCVDGATTCTKVWNGTLSSGGLLHDGVFRIKAHIKDLSNADYNEYLSPYVITVDVPE